MHLAVLGMEANPVLRRTPDVDIIEGVDAEPGTLVHYNAHAVWRVPLPHRVGEVVVEVSKNA